MFSRESPQKIMGMCHFYGIPLHDRQGNLKSYSAMSYDLNFYLKHQKEIAVLKAQFNYELNFFRNLNVKTAENLQPQ